MDNEAARSIVNNLKINKNYQRDKNGLKTIKLPFDLEEDDKHVEYQIYRGLKDRYMTEKEKEEERKESHQKASSYLHAKRILRELSKDSRMANAAADDEKNSFSLSYDSSD